jgi:hypothetical protein
LPHHYSIACCAEALRHSATDLRELRFSFDVPASSEEDQLELREYGESIA